MAKKQVTVNEELLRGIMAGDVPVYGKNAPKDVIIDEESVEEDIQEKGDDTGGHDMKSAVRQKKRKDESGSYRRQFLKGGNIQLRQQAYISLENSSSYGDSCPLWPRESVCQNISMIF